MMEVERVVSVLAACLLLGTVLACAVVLVVVVLVPNDPDHSHGGDAQGFDDKADAPTIVSSDNSTTDALEQAELELPPVHDGSLESAEQGAFVMASSNRRSSNHNRHPIRSLQGYAPIVTTAATEP